MDAHTIINHAAWHVLRLVYDRRIGWRDGMGAWYILDAARQQLANNLA